MGQAKGAMSFLHWLLVLLLVAALTYAGGRFLYGYWGGDTHSCPVGKLCIDELS